MPPSANARITRRWLRVGMLALLSAVVVAVVVTGFVVNSGKVTPTAAVEPIAVAASDAFSSWTVGTGGAKFVASRQAASGRYSLEIDRSASPSKQAAMSQTVTSTPGSRATVTFRAAASDSSGAVRVTLGSSGVTLPSGTYDWRQLSFTTSLDAATTDLRIVASGGDGLVRIDGMKVVDPGQATGPQNGDFEQNSAPLHLTNDSLLWTTSTGTLNLASRESSSASFTWKVTNALGTVAAQGEGKLSAGHAAVHLDLAPGYYRFSVQATVDGASVSPSASFGVVRPVTLSDSSTGTELGIGIHMTSVPDATFTRWIAALKASGFRYARTDVWWGDFERVRGQYVYPAIYTRRIAQLEAAGLRPLLIPGYSNPLYDGGRTPSSSAGEAAYARFVAAIAQHYPAADIDVYNEFNTVLANSSCGRSASCYLPLLRSTDDALRGLSASGRLVTAPSVGGPGVRLDWLTPFIAGGGLDDANVLSLHPYLEVAAPENLSHDLATLRALMAAHGSTQPIWFTEFGYSTSLQRVSEQKQAAYLSESIVTAARFGVDRIYWYDGFNDGVAPGDIESNFGLFRRPAAFAPNAWQPKPAAVAAAVAQRLIAGRGEVDAPAVGTDPARVAEFAGGTRLIWTTGAARTVSLPGRYNVFSMTGESVAAVTNGDTTAVTARGTPVYAVPAG